MENRLRDPLILHLEFTQPVVSTVNYCFALSPAQIKRTPKPTRRVRKTRKTGWDTGENYTSGRRRHREEKATPCSCIRASTRGASTAAAARRPGRAQRPRRWAAVTAWTPAGGRPPSSRGRAGSTRPSPTGTTAAPPPSRPSRGSRASRGRSRRAAAEGEGAGRPLRGWTG